MPLSFPEIKGRALRFSDDWKSATRERAEKDTFWNEFFNIFGISRRRVATFEHSVRKLNEQSGFIDAFWPGHILIEHKSRGRDLQKAFRQALDYCHVLPEHEVPRYILLCDFYDFHLHDLEEKTTVEFTLPELHENLHHFSFIAGYKRKTYPSEDPVNIKAAERMGKLHDRLRETGYDGHELEVYLVRLLFCLFAEDTGIFEKGVFQEYIERNTREDGSDLAMHLSAIFEALNTPPEERFEGDQFAAFPYVNGDLFSERLRFAQFDGAMRLRLLYACALDWSKISPAIFGAMFQSVMNPEQRRNLGAHYTSEQNILRLIEPLFLEELRQELEGCGTNTRKLRQFHQKLSRLTFLDPACGCGNFLIITYRELRLLEIEVLRRLQNSGQLVMNIADIVRVDVDQFFGIEYDEFPVRIAEVALWLTDHQMNLRVSEEFGEFFVRLPLRKSATIRHGNALRTDWHELIPPKDLHYILGNPPFYGSKYQSPEQRQEIRDVFGNVKGVGTMDYVTGWYIKAADFCQENPAIRCAFVSTNSISQGEQVGILWRELFSKSVQIHFAHRTFRWSNEAKGNAAVHVVIIGFGQGEVKPIRLFEYEDIQGDPQEISVKNINPYLVEGKDVLLFNRQTPISEIPKIGIGNKPIDGGHYIFSEEGKAEFLAKEPQAEAFFREFVGATEFLYNKKRWILWLGDASPSELQAMPHVLERIEAVQNYRQASKSKPTRKLAETPTRFHVENMPTSNYLLIPEVTSERRKYIPIGFMPPEVLCSNLVKISEEASPYQFGVLTSEMHMTWMRYVAGRLESRFRYSVKLVYNNFPFPTEVSDTQKAAVEAAAEAVLAARGRYPDSNLAALYDPRTMPPDLRKAHSQLDKAVDKCYRKKAFSGERERMGWLFGILGDG